MPTPPVARCSELAEATPVKVDVDGTPVCVVRIGDVVYAIDDTCSHADASLSEGEVDVDDLTIECPMHGSPFRVTDGVPVGLPATRPVRVHDVVLDGDDVRLAD